MIFGGEGSDSCDIFQIDTGIGEVRRIGIRACVIRTVDGSEVIVPNGIIISRKVTNWTLSDWYRVIEVSVTVARGAATSITRLPALGKSQAECENCGSQPAAQRYRASAAPERSRNSRYLRGRFARSHLTRLAGSTEVGRPALESNCMNLFKAYSGFIQIHDTPVLNIGVTFHCDHEMEVMRVAFC